jgi:hypothetical protein
MGGFKVARWLGDEGSVVEFGVTGSTHPWTNFWHVFDLGATGAWSYDIRDVHILVVGSLEVMTFAIDLGKLRRVLTQRTPAASGREIWGILDRL